MEEMRYVFVTHVLVDAYTRLKYIRGRGLLPLTDGRVNE